MTLLEDVGQAPHHELARAKYRHHASRYDLFSAAATPLRQAAVTLLAPRPGAVVVDVGCGTGLNFQAIEAGIGPTGRLIGVDACPQMLTKARRRAADQGWRNVSLVQSPVADAPLPARVDAVLFSLVHDVMRTPAALEHVLAHVRPGGRVVAAGAKLAASSMWWAPMLNRLVLSVNRPYVTSVEGLERPWSHLGRLLPGLTAYPDPWDVTYVAWGSAP